MPVLPRQRTLALHRPAILRRRLHQQPEHCQGDAQPVCGVGGVDEEGRLTFFFACSGLIAGKPAPTVGMHFPVGAGLARDDDRPSTAFPQAV